MIPKTKKDWTEDFEHENGNYTNTCIDCGELFLGHKRRVICKECANPKMFTIEDVKNALHEAELRHDKNYINVWAIMEEALNQSVIDEEVALPSENNMTELTTDITEVSENSEFIELEHKDHNETWYETIYYIKCFNYNGYGMKVKNPLPKDYLLNNPHSIKFWTHWISLNKIDDNIFEVVVNVPINVQYVSKQTLVPNNNFKFIYNDEAKKVHGNIILPSDKYVIKK